MGTIDTNIVYDYSKPFFFFQKFKIVFDYSKLVYFALMSQMRQTMSIKLGF